MEFQQHMMWHGWKYILSILTILALGMVVLGVLGYLTVTQVRQELTTVLESQLLEQKSMEDLQLMTEGIVNTQEKMASGLPTPIPTPTPAPRILRPRGTVDIGEKLPPGAATILTWNFKPLETIRVTLSGAGPYPVSILFQGPSGEELQSFARTKVGTFEHIANEEGVYTLTITNGGISGSTGISGNFIIWTFDDE